jgi:predicted DNA-binding antitoxin AbrB/MazE fold protein
MFQDGSIGKDAEMKTIHAVYENGVFRPTEAVDLPDRCEVEVEIRQIKEEPKKQVPMSEGLAKIYAILGERYDSGYTDTAERHNEHQP